MGPNRTKDERFNALHLRGIEVAGIGLCFVEYHLDRGKLAKMPRRPFRKVEPRSCIVEYALEVV